MHSPPSPPVAVGTPRARLRIGAWIVDPESNELHRGDSVVRVEPKAMDVLMTLAASPGQVVAREDLLAAVWPGVVVGDEALTQSVIKLRRALSDDPRAPSCIETIPKRGYRLIAPVAPVDGNVPAPPTAAKAVPRLAARSRLWVGMGLAILVALAIVAAVHVREPPDALDPVDPLSARVPWIGIGVVPFESLAAEGEQDYLAQGIRENLMTDLGRIPVLRVIRDAGSSADGAARGIRYRVSGAVQRDGGRVRVTIQLVDTGSGEQIWAARFDRARGDLLEMQDEITRALVDVLPTRIDAAERRRLAHRYTNSVDAYESFLRGRAAFLVRTDEANEQARRHFREAVEVDPKFARAYAAMAMTYALDGRLREADDRSRALARAAELAETARGIDPDLPETHWAIAFVNAQRRDHARAMDSAARAIRLDRSFADGYALMAGVYTYIGMPARSVPLLRAAMRLDPDGGYLYYLLLGRAYLFLDDVDQSLVNLRAAALRNPADVETRVYLAAALLARGDDVAAQWEAVEIRSLRPDFSAARWIESYPMTDVRQRARLVSALVRCGL